MKSPEKKKARKSTSQVIHVYTQLSVLQNVDHS